MACRHWFVCILTGSLAFGQQAAELETKEAPAKFTSRVNLVPLTVVVRDRDGHAIGTLTKDDFRILDNGKPQVISRFSVEKPGAAVAVPKDAQELEEGAAPKPAQAGARAATPLPDHFVAYLFDDIHVKFEDLARARDAAGNVIAHSMHPADRAAIYTTSGQIVQEFTNDQAKLLGTLARVRPTSVTGSSSHGVRCPDISYYMADRIVNLNDSQALQVALLNYQACSGNPYVSAPEVLAFAQSALHDGEYETRVTASVVKQVIRRMMAMPGQRSIVLSSPGFLVPFADQSDITDLINRAIHAKVVISTLDVRGLWTPPAYDAARGGVVSPQVMTMINLYMNQEAVAQEAILEDLADSTGGQWFHANNDLLEGFRRLAGAPEFIYVLAFTPLELKSDGKYHKLRVLLRDPKGLTVQARKGYYAPKGDTNGADVTKQEIEDAVFSREVIRDIPLAVHTQFFRSGDADANLSVISQLDIRSLPYRKEEGRNRDTLTVVSALFDPDGNFVAGEQKTVEMRLKDATLERIGPGIRLKSSFSVKIGSYVVRVVVRDSQGHMMASENTAVNIE